MPLTWSLLRMEQLPRLAWLAECTGLGVKILHGPAVETGSSFFFEGAWAGAFGEHGFGSAATVMGSGAIASDGGILFVPPSHTLEGLYYHQSGDCFTISNSLVFLLERVGAELPYDPHGGRRFASAVLGIEDHEQPVLLTSNGPVERLLHHNLSWRPDERTQLLRKPLLEAPASFEAYRRTLREELEAVFANAADQGRTGGRYSPVSTCSSGYDSTACLVLGHELGCRKAVTLTTARGGEDDSGAGIAAQLGVELHPFERATSFGAEQLAEFVATGMGGEDVIYSAFGPVLPGCLLLTGFHGDKIWSNDAKPNSVLARGDISGSSMTEFRLRIGFIHVPVPFIAAQHHGSVRAISNCEEMRPWSVGGEYDRPIPRRIAEEAGIPRLAFGMDKKAASLLLFRNSEERTSNLKATLVERQRPPGLAGLTRGLRQRLFEPRLALAYRLEHLQNRSRLARMLTKVVPTLASMDPRLIEHDCPAASISFRLAISKIRPRYACELRRSA